MPHGGKHSKADWRPEDIKEILETVSETVPDLLEKLSDVLYSKENAEKYAEAVGIFYKNLIDAGMESEQAYALTEKYMSNLSPMSHMGGMFKGSMYKHHGHDDDDDDD